MEHVQNLLKSAKKRDSNEIKIILNQIGFKTRIILDSKTFEILLGSNSPIFLVGQMIIEEYIRGNENKDYLRNKREKWVQNFSKVYQNEDLDENLYIKHAYLSLLIKIVLFSKYLPEKGKFTVEDFNELVIWFKNHKIDLFLNDLFEWVSEITPLCDILFFSLQDANYESEDIFRVIYQEMIAPDTRHALGEFYTPPKLAQLMIDESYNFGDVVLDPSCGSGTFLVEILSRVRNDEKKIIDQIKAINNLYGFDLNPIAVMVTKANLLLQCKDLFEQGIKINIFLEDALFPSENVIQIDQFFDSHFRKPIGIETKKENYKHKFNLIIGNPPWLVLNGIYSLEYKKRVKNLATRLDIMIGGKLATHTEITSIFFYHCSDIFLKENGKIFFVTTAGLMTGDQHSKFRRFRNFGDIFIWNFENDIFRIHSICMGMTKKKQNFLSKLRIPVRNIKNSLKNDLNSDEYNFQMGAEEVYIPYNIDEIHSEKDPVKRLIPISEKENLLPTGIAYCYESFFQGASIVPRNLLFVNVKDSQVEDSRNAISSIEPNMEIQQKPPWNFKPYDETQVESKYIFDLAKSTELIPFNLVFTNKIFLPIDRNKNNYQMNDPQILPLAKKHFKRLDKLYKSHQKKGASITDLWERIDYQKGITNPTQIGDIKVIYAGIGSMIKSAIVTNKVIIDTSLYYYSTKSLDEAYYLMGILNSQSISRDLTLRGSTGANGSLRNLHKKPLEYPIPKFDPTNQLHRNIINLAKEMEEKVRIIVNNWLKKEKIRLESFEQKNSSKEERIPKEIFIQNIKIKPKSIKRKVLDKLNPDFKKLDKFIVNLFK